MNYPVPHFGMDRTIQDGLVNLSVAEKIVKHNWKGIDKDKYSNPAKKVDYNFAPELDSQIIDSQKDLANAEVSLDHKYELVQLNSDPICSSAGCDQYKHPEKKDDWDRNYPVAHFGMDRNIQDGLVNIEIAEKIVGHHWAGIDKDKWANPAKKVDYNFDPKLDGDMIDAISNQAIAEKQLGKMYELD